MDKMTPSHIEQHQLELAAAAAGLTYLMYVPDSPPHPSGLLYRPAPDSRLTVWNPFRDDGDLFRLALALPDADLNQTIVEARAAGTDDLARRVREAFVHAVTKRLQAHQLASLPEPSTNNLAPDRARAANEREDQAASA